MDLKREINISKKFIIIMLLVNIIVIGLQTSYAYFQVNVIKKSVVVIKTAVITMSIESPDLTNNKTLSLAAEESKTVTLTITNESEHDALARLYYIGDITDITFESDTTFKDENNTPIGRINKGQSQELTITITNNTESSTTIELGAQEGLIGYDLPLYEGRNSITLVVSPPQFLVDTFREVLATRTSTTSTEDGITYISGAKDDDNPETTDDVDYNYVWYSGKMWRITSVNSDGTMKLITDKGITSIAYGSDVNFYTDEENTSYVYQWLNEDFLDTLYNYENIIVTDSKWNATNSSTITSTASEASATSKNSIIASNLKGENEDIKVLQLAPPIVEETVLVDTKLPETTMITAPVGLLNSYEYYKSYENLGSTAYDSGYLNIGYTWCLLNPYSSTSMWIVSSYGSAGYNDPTYANATRPSINLKSTIEFSGGSGTKSDPYRIKGDKEEAIANTTKSNTRQSGEYVKFDGELYRIVGIENNTTKLNKMDYVRGASDAVITQTFSSSRSYVTYGGTGTTGENYWAGYLNNTWKTAISDEYENMLVEGTYYLGEVSVAASYKYSICATASNTITTKECTKTTSAWTGFVGLPRYGEMFAAQQGSGYSTSSDMWLITSYSPSYVWRVNNICHAVYNFPTYANATRPSIHLKSDVVITGGSGIESDPYEIGVA